jgi:hypothetical protein
MGQELPIDPFKLTFEGLDADHHRADALLVGQCLVGTARAYNSVINWHFAGKPVAPSSQVIRVHVGPPEEGSLFYAIYLMMVHGKMIVFPDLFYDVAKIAIPLWFKAMIERRSGQKPAMDKTLDVIADMYARHDDFARQVHADHVREKDHLYALLEKLAVTNKKPLSDMATPIGKTVKSIEHFSDTPLPIIVDEATAEALTSKEEAVVGDVAPYKAKVLAVDTITGTAKLLIEGDLLPVRARITDPSLKVPENPYTHALDTALSVMVSAKPVLKDGVVSTLYVSDAKLIV